MFTSYFRYESNDVFSIVELGNIGQNVVHFRIYQIIKKEKEISSNQNFYNFKRRKKK